jgi:hypothetical protein
MVVRERGMQGLVAGVVEIMILEEKEAREHPLSFSG